MPNRPEMFHAKAESFSSVGDIAGWIRAWRAPISLVRLDSQMEAKRRSNARSSRHRRRRRGPAQRSRPPRWELACDLMREDATRSDKHTASTLIWCC